MFFGKKKKKNDDEDDDIFESFLGNDFSKIMKRMMEDMEGMMKQSEMREIDFDEDEQRPMVRKRTYGFSMNIGPDGKVKIEEFGDIPAKQKMKKGRQPLVDVINKEKEITVIAELPGVESNEIKLKLSDLNKKLIIEVPEKFYKELKLPEKVKKIEKQTYKNGVLEIELKK